MFCYMTLYSPISVHAFISEKCPWVLPIIYLEAFPTFSTQIYQTRHTILGSNHTIQTEALCSRIFCPQRLDEQEGRTDRHQAKKEVLKSRGERSLTWLQTGLYLSPGFFRIFSSCLWLKLDTPMDLVSPASLHVSRAWGAGVVSSHFK